MLLQRACVKVSAPGKLAPVIETRIVLDSGSQRSYISRQLSEALGLKEEQKETLLVKAFAAEEGCAVWLVLVWKRRQDWT